MHQRFTSGFVSKDYSFLTLPKVLGWLVITAFFTIVEFVKIVGTDYTSQRATNL